MREWGSWLRAPVKRSVGQDRSKFLRDEKDAAWDVNYGNSNNSQRFSGDYVNQVVQTDFQGRIFSEALSSRENNQGFNSSNKDKAVLAANFKSFDGPSEEELTGLNLEESNKRKRGPNNNSLMEIEGGYVGALSETGLSNADCPVSSTNVLATLARQASHLQ